MHTRVCEGGTTFHFNGDFSGNLHVYPKDGEQDIVIIPAKDVLELIAREYVLPRMQDKLAGMEDFDLLFNHLIEGLG